MQKIGIGFSIFLIVLCIFIANIHAYSESEQIIVIDAGHGGMDGGASIGSIKESILTLQIAKKLQEVCETSGLKVIMTRTEDISLNEGEFVKREDMVNRVKIINSSNAELAISIHLNKFSIPKYRGAQVFYSKSNQQNELLANMVQKSLGFYLGNTERNIVLRDNVFLLNKVVIPCCIVECGFMSNSEELFLLQTEEYQYKVVNSILYAISDFLRLY